MSHKRYSRSAMIDSVVRLLLRQGWTIKSNNRHLKIADPTGKVIVPVPGSPSDHRSEKNWLHQLRRATGVDYAAAAAA